MILFDVPIVNLNAVQLHMKVIAHVVIKFVRWNQWIQNLQSLQWINLSLNMHVKIVIKMIKSKVLNHQRRKERRILVKKYKRIRILYFKKVHIMVKVTPIKTWYTISKTIVNHCIHALLNAKTKKRCSNLKYTNTSKKTVLNVLFNV